MSDRSEQHSPRDPLLPLVQGDWVRLDTEDWLVAVVVECKQTRHGLYVKLVPVEEGGGQPFWVPAHRCRRIPPIGDGGL